MATDAERKQLRTDLGLAETDTASLPDAQADIILTMAASLYTTASTLYAGTRVLYYEYAWAVASDAVDYTQNMESERLGQLADNKYKLLLYWRKKLDDALEEDDLTRTSAARFGRTRRKPARLKEYPDGSGWVGWGHGWWPR